MNYFIIYIDYNIYKKYKKIYIKILSKDIYFILLFV